MCDYSLHFVASRRARVGDRLVSTRFRNSLTRGFAAIGEPDTAVCLLPGPKLRLRKMWNAMDHSASFAVAVLNKGSRAFGRSI